MEQEMSLNIISLFTKSLFLIWWINLAPSCLIFNINLTAENLIMIN